jgi:hypothetical protein
MGYRGLLLNDPYKIDRMGCVCGLDSFLCSFLLFVLYIPGLYEPGGKMGDKALKGSNRVFRSISEF